MTVYLLATEYDIDSVAVGDTAVTVYLLVTQYDSDGEHVGNTV